MKDKNKEKLRLKRLEKDRQRKIFKAKERLKNAPSRSFQIFRFIILFVGLLNTESKYLSMFLLFLIVYYLWDSTF